MSTRIKQIKVYNCKAIDFKTLDLNGCTAIIIGGNDKGKTTLSRALIDRFRGVKSDFIVRATERSGFYEMTLTNGEIITWDFSINGDEKLSITVDGERHRLTKEMMKYYFPSSFDVDKFLNDFPAEQQKKLAKLTGLDFTDIDRAYKEADEERKYHNKKLKDLEAQQIQYEPHWTDVVQDLEPLRKELTDVSAHNTKFVTIKTKLDDKKNKLVEEYKLIEAYKQNLKEAEERAMQLETEIDKGNSWIDNEANKPKDENYTKNLLNKIKDIEQNNFAIQKTKELEKQERIVEDIKLSLKKILNDKSEMIRLADMPDGFGFNEEGITYNMLPFNRQAQSSSSLYIGALKLAERSLGQVKVIHFDASYLDKNNIQKVKEWAESNNLQLLIERPDFDCGEIRYEIIEE